MHFGLSKRWGGFSKLGHPHDTSWLDNENVMVLGCGGHLPGFEVGSSEILRIDIKNDDIVWEFTEVPSVCFYTSCKGSFQRLPNGNILICEGDTGRLFEVTERKEVTWEFINLFYHPSPIHKRNNMLFRAYRYGPDYGGLKGNTVQSDRFQPVLEEKGKIRVGEVYTSEDEHAARSRLNFLGY